MGNLPMDAEAASEAFSTVVYSLCNAFILSYV